MAVISSRGRRHRSISVRVGGISGARAGKVANGITVVYLSYVHEELAGRPRARQWIPQEHIDDPVTSLVMGLPLDLAFRTKGS